jgi:hypothetical protein
MKKIKNLNLISYVFLLVSLLLIFLSFAYKDWSVYQYVIIFMAVAIYLATSVIHHHYDRSLTFEIGLEYILIGALAFLVIFGIAL